MTDKYLNIRCPFCGKNAIHVAVCDDEGNYRGLIGRSEYELDSYSGIGYYLTHDGWGECLLCTDEGGCLGGMIFDTPDEALKALKISPCKDDTNLY